MNLFSFRFAMIALLLLTISCTLQGAETISLKKNISVMAQRFDSKKINFDAVSKFIEPAPLNELSADELKKFPRAIVTAAAEIESPEPGKKIRIRILKTEFKYPALRTEEVIDVAKNALLSRHEMVANHFLVTLAPGEDPEIFLKCLGPQAFSIVKISEDASLYRVNLASSSLEALPEALEKAASATAGVSEPNFITHLADVSGSDQVVIPNNPLFQCQWGLSSITPNFSDPNTGYSSSCVGCDAVDAWKIRTDASSVIVAVIDSGIRYTHEDLAANMWNNPDSMVTGLHGWNAYDDNDIPMDNNGHGTHCAGIIGAVGNSGVGVSGVAWKVQLMACKASDSNGSSTSQDDIIAIDYARNHGAKILSCSWGGPSFSSAEFDAFDRARTAGMIVVCAAGNDSKDNDAIPVYPACFDVAHAASGNLPATYALDNIVSVAAMGLGDQLASFSNYGATTVHLAAPGYLICSTWNGSDSDYELDSGTSMATPFVAGAFALLAAEFPMESYQSLMARLLAATDQTPSLAGKTITGGRLNIARALIEACPSSEPAPTDSQH